MPVLAENHYGKSKVRLLKVVRHQTHQDVHDWTLGIYLTGDFDRCYTLGDNTGVMATDTMKNSVYAHARQSSASTAEAFALELAEALLKRNQTAQSVRITVEEKMWVRLKAGQPGERGYTAEHPSAFLQRGPDVATTEVILLRGGAPVLHAGVRGLVILKTAQSAFHGFERDELTTLPEATDRLLGTEATVTWTYTHLPRDPDATRKHIMDTLLTTFARHDSLSVQHTLYAMAEAVLAAEPLVAGLDLTMPNRHNLPAQLGPLGLDNPNTIFIPTDEPHGHISARVTR